MADEVKTEEKKEEAVAEAKADEKPVVEDAPKPETETAAEPVEEKAPEPVKDEKPAEEPKEEPKPEAEPKPEEAAAEEEPAEEKSAAPEEKTVESEPAKEEPKDATPTKVEPAPAKTEAKEEEPKPEEAPKAKGPKKTVGLPPDKVLLFGKYNLSEVVIHDPGLEKYLNIDPIMVPHTGAKHANRWFGKTKLHIIERLLNNLMRTEDFTGKKAKGYKVIRDSFEIIEKRTKTHPVQVLVDALENSAPREEITRLRYGGISVPKAVDTSSSRRLDIAFRNICKGAVNSSYKNSKPIEVCLANEIVLASKKDMNSFAVSKKEELERVAASAR